MDPEDMVGPKKEAPNWVLAIGSKPANHTPLAIFFFKNGDNSELWQLTGE